MTLGRAHRAYALRDDGVLFRWFIQPVNGQPRVEGGRLIRGFSAVKSVALISRTSTYDTLLLGIDKDTKSGYLYAVGDANGTATAIKGLGKVPATFGEQVNFRWSSRDDYRPYGD
jgi:hypothetical protein